ncbi:FG-GAP-like repeat-containing protein [Danxiaibacter flavus]|uniref:FG-GAP-like repeat-containing protein n=1 Tax=Danxiaibacter flavus TaxID=3049108 RepID=A0ABV3ZLG4_9BACT|nr:FG-GAP-like repeat-containing protein [Chitinophagaceae bacterium DXS]
MLIVCLLCQQLFAQPVITSFSPLSGLPGSTVTINGSGFSSMAAENIVLIGGTRAYVIAASANKLTVQVPRGITTKPISVTVNHLTGFSSVAYITTYKTGNIFSPGTFATPQNFYMNPRTTVHDGLAIEDLDGDGKPDMLAMAYFYDPFYAAYRNTSTRGNISFTKPVTAAIPISYTTNQPLLADFNGDGKKDMFFFNEGQFDIRLNTSLNGAISFNKTILMNLNKRDDFYIFSANAVDLNADGKADIYFQDQFVHQDSIFYVLNTSSGDEVSFSQPMALPFHAAALYSFVDFNGDQKVDMLYPEGDSMVIRINTSKNGVVSFGNPVGVYVSTLGLFYGVADVNKDGKPDIIMSNQQDSWYFLLNASTFGTPSFGKPLTVPLGFFVENTRFVDIDGDGKLDITGYDIVSKNYEIVKNTSTAGRLSFATPVSFPNIKSRGMEYGDFDGDGRQDLAFSATTYLSFITVLRNQTDTARGIPSIESFSPAAALPGDTVTIQGNNFNGTTNVSLGGTAVQSFKIASNNKISAVVAQGSTGDVRVTTTMGTATKPVFKYLTDTTVKIETQDTGLVCTGITVHAGVTVTNAYNNIIYTWYRNGNVDFGNHNFYASQNVKNGDSVWCVISFRNLPTDRVWRSNTIKFKMDLSQTLKLRIESSKGTLICKGASVTFKAIVNYVDVKQAYQWQKNNIVVGDTTDTYVDSNLKNGDVIRCLIVRARHCVTLPRAASLQMTVDESRPLAPVTINGPDEVSPFQSNIIFSVPEVAGARSYKWQIPSGTSFVSGNGTDSVTVNWSSTTAKISAGASNACGVSPVITKTVRVTSTNTRIAQKEISKEFTNETESVVIYPNPANSKTTVVFNGTNNKYSAMELRDANGKLLLYKKVQTVKGEMKTNINTAAYAPGVYYIVLIDQNNKTTSKQLMIVK